MKSEIIHHRLAQFDQELKKPITAGNNCPSDNYPAYAVTQSAAFVNKQGIERLERMMQSMNHQRNRALFNSSRSAFIRT